MKTLLITLAALVIFFAPLIDATQSPDVKVFCIKDRRGGQLSIDTEGYYSVWMKTGERFSGRAEIEERGNLLAFQDQQLAVIDKRTGEVKQPGYGVLGHIMLDSRRAEAGVSYDCKPEFIATNSYALGACGE